MKLVQKLSLGDISVNFALVILKSLEQQGIDSGQLRKDYALTEDFLNTPDARISIPKYMRLGHQAIYQSKQPSIGLKFGENTAVSDIGLGGFAATCSDTIGESLALLIRMEPLNSYNSRGKSQYYIEDDRAVCEFYSISPYNKFNCFVVDTMLSTWWNFIRNYQYDAMPCHHVEIEYPKPSNAHEFEEYFGCPVLFNRSRNAIILKRYQHKLKTKTPHKSTFQKLQKLCEKELEQWNSGKDISRNVIELISENLTGTPPEIDTIARKLGVAGWTLRRQLNKEGKQYQTLLDDTRNALAQSYVRDTNHNFTEIAFLLGFSSPSAFQRAFKRWTQVSPGKFRSKNTQ